MQESLPHLLRRRLPSFVCGRELLCGAFGPTHWCLRSWPHEVQMPHRVYTYASPTSSIFAHTIVLNPNLDRACLLCKNSCPDLAIAVQLKERLHFEVFGVGVHIEVFGHVRQAHPITEAIFSDDNGLQHHSNRPDVGALTLPLESRGPPRANRLQVEFQQLRLDSHKFYPRCVQQGICPWTLPLYSHLCLHDLSNIVFNVELDLPALPNHQR
mmetsp:Transcript_30342/g.66418  ORF Transcript_30342/g.66418 Transcript_30342/m.66418 type:complete len:212 (+) Transcript_30342:1441-2076(+)